MISWNRYRMVGRLNGFIGWLSRKLTNLSTILQCGLAWLQQRAHPTDAPTSCQTPFLLGLPLRSRSYHIPTMPNHKVGASYSFAQLVKAYNADLQVTPVHISIIFIMHFRLNSAAVMPAVCGAIISRCSMAGRYQSECHRPRIGN